MSNWIDMHLDILAASPTEVDGIEEALKHPCQELTEWVAQRWGEDPKEIAAAVKEIVSFEPKGNLRYTNPTVNEARRFAISFRDRFTGIVWSHVLFVSRDFPSATFLAEYWNVQVSSAGRRVIRAGRDIRSSHDGNQQAQGYEWVFPNIFAPYLVEFELGLEFGSLWNRWLGEMQRELADLKTYYGGSNIAKPEEETA